MTAYPALLHLLQGYLHLDWIEEYGDPWAAVLDFARLEPKNASAIGGEIDSVLGKHSSESELRHFLVDECGSGYLPDADGWTYADWLKEVKVRIATAK